MLDEPSLGLAPRIVRDIFRTIVGLGERGVSLLVVEQNARAAMQIADYCYVMEQGRMVLEGLAVRAAGRRTRRRELSGRPCARRRAIVKGDDMMEIAIPYGGYWSSPFAKWQGKLAHLHSLRFAAHVAKHSLERRGIEPAVFDFGVLGMTVPQKQSFYGLPWLMGEIGADRVTGPTINQACATSARILETASSEIASGHATVALAIATDRTSNGPHIYYPAPQPDRAAPAIMKTGCSTISRTILTRSLR